MPERYFSRMLRFLGHLVFVVLIVLAWEHSVLRSTIADTAFQFFKWVNNDGLNVEAHRYAAILPQLLVKGGKVLGLDLSQLMLTSSLGHVLVGYIVFVLCAHVFRSPSSALGCALAAVLSTRLTFYSPVLEATYLLSYPFLFLAILDPSSGALPRVQWSRRRKILACLCALPTLIVHPLGSAVLVAFGLLAAGVQWWSWRNALWSMFSIGLFVLCWRIAFPPTAYESLLVSNSVVGTMGQGSWLSAQFLWAHCFRDSNAYLPLLMLTVAVVVCWFALRRHLMGCVSALTMGGSMCAYLILVRSGDTAIMMERALLPMSAVVAASFALLQDCSRNRLRIVLAFVLTIVSVVKLRDISFGSRQFEGVTGHAVEVGRELAQRGIRKACVTEEQLIDMNWGIGWAAPVELLLLSARTSPDSSVTVLVREDSADDGCSYDGGLILRDYSLPLTKMNEVYFRLPSGPYVRLPEER